MPYIREHEINSTPTNSLFAKSVNIHEDMSRDLPLWPRLSVQTSAAEWQWTRVAVLGLWTSQRAAYPSIQTLTYTKEQ